MNELYSSAIFCSISQLLKLWTHRTHYSNIYTKSFKIFRSPLLMTSSLFTYFWTYILMRNANWKQKRAWSKCLFNKCRFHFHLNFRVIERGQVFIRGKRKYSKKGRLLKLIMQVYQLSLFSYRKMSMLGNCMILYFNRFYLLIPSTTEMHSHKSFAFRNCLERRQQ